MWYLLGFSDHRSAVETNKFCVFPFSAKAELHRRLLYVQEVVALQKKY